MTRDPSRANARARRAALRGRMALCAAGLACSVGGAQATADGPVAAAPSAQPVLAVCADPAGLPYSNERAEGFENRIAQWLAQDLGARLQFTWNLQRRGFLRRTLGAERCDVVLGVPVGLGGVLQTRAYYTSTYVFVTRADGSPAPTGFDDPWLRQARIGVHAVAAEGSNPPPVRALALRGLSDHVVGYPVWGAEDDDAPQAALIDAVARGDIDVAVAWGPLAGFHARRHDHALRVTPVADDPLQPQVPLRYAMAAGVRKGDTALLALVQGALDRRGPDIQALLQAYGVPLVPSPTAGGVAALHQPEGN